MFGKIRDFLGWILKLDKALLEWLLDQTHLPDNWKQGDYTDVFEALNPFAPFAKIYLADRDYYFCEAEEIREFLEVDLTDRETYISETHDCDDFSFRLMGQFHEKPYSALAFGIAWSQVHAFNIFIDKIGTVWVVEPQNDQVTRLEEMFDEVYTDLQLVVM